jgi:hypothetical protein
MITSNSKILNLVDQAVNITPNIKVLPIVHGSLEFTLLLKKHFFDNPPDIVAVELPFYLEQYLDKAVPFIQSYPVLQIEADFKGYLVLEPLEPIVEAIRNCYEQQISLYYIDNPPINANLISLYRYFDEFPDTYSLHYISIKDLLDLLKKSQSMVQHPIDLYREVYMSLELKKLQEEYPNKNILLVCGIKHFHQIEYFIQQPTKKLEELKDSFEFQLKQNHAQFDLDKLKVEIYSLSENSPEILFQPGYYNNLWNKFRNEPRSWKYFDRVQLQRNVYRLTKNEYENQSGEIVPPQKEKYFFQFARNLSILHKKLIPIPLFLIHAAKGFVNDNFAKIFYEKLMNIEKESSPFPELTLSLEELGLDSEIVRFRTKLYKPHTKMVKEIKSKIHKEQYPGQWRELWDNYGMCSYPPEDIILEEYGNYLRKKALSLVKSLESKSFPFTSSLYDGIDYRETIRNYYKNTIYVKELLKSNWDAGNIVVIFSNDEEKYFWKSVWWGEHDQEGDMAFYATSPEENIVGPGIARCIYGGFLLSYPPGRLSYIWEDYEFRNFRTAKEKLLAAAIIYNVKNTIVYVADKPPTKKMNYFATRFGQKIVYIPISILNQKKLARIRRFHVLDGHNRREDADKYIW